MVTPPRQVLPTLKFIDDYCQNYQHLFTEVRNYESFKLLHLGLLSEYSDPKSFVNFLLPPRTRGEGWGGVKKLRLI